MRLHIILLSLLLLTVVIPLSLAQTAEPDVVTHVSSLDFSPDGETLAVGTGADTLCLGRDIFKIQLINLELDTGEWLSGHACPIVSLDFNFDGTRLVSSDSGSRIIAWDVINSIELARRFTNALNSVSWSPLENIFLAQNEFGFTVVDQEIVYISGHVSQNVKLTKAVWNPVGDKIAFGDVAGAIFIWNTPTDVIELTTNHHLAPITTLDWHPINNTITSTDEDGTIHIWDVSTGDLLTSAFTHQTIHDLVWSPDGKLLASTGDDGFVRVWAIQNSAVDAQPTLTELTSFDYGAPVYAVAWSPDGATIAYGGRGVDGQNGQVEIVDVSALVCTHTPKSSLSPASPEISPPKP